MFWKRSNLQRKSAICKINTEFCRGWFRPSHALLLSASPNLYVTHSNAELMLYSPYAAVILLQLSYTTGIFVSGALSPSLKYEITMGRWSMNISLLNWRLVPFIIAWIVIKLWCLNSQVCTSPLVTKTLTIMSWTQQHRTEFLVTQQVLARAGISCFFRVITAAQIIVSSR